MPESTELDAKLLPSVSLNLRIPSEGETVMKIGDQVLRGVTNCKVEMDAEKMFPVVTVTFVAKQVQLETNAAVLKTDRPVITIPVINKEK